MIFAKYSGKCCAGKKNITYQNKRVSTQQYVSFLPFLHYLLKSNLVLKQLRHRRGSNSRSSVYETDALPLGHCANSGRKIIHHCICHKNKNQHFAKNFTKKVQLLQQKCQKFSMPSVQHNNVSYHKFLYPI